MSDSLTRTEAIVREVEQLTAALLEGVLDDPSTLRLQSLVTTHVSARRTYVRWMHQEAALYQMGAAMTAPVPGEGFTAGSSLPVAPSSRGGLTVAWRRILGFSLVSMALLAAITLGSLAWPERDSDHLAVASLVRDVDAEWVTEGTVIRLHGDFPQAPVELRNGLGDLSFTSGVRVVVQAPAALEVLTPMRLRLTRGSVVVKAPPGVHDFVVETPGGQVVDLGTEFGVRVNQEEDSSVHVFDGEVRVETSGIDVNLVEDEGLRFTVSGESRDAPPAAESFLRSLTPPQTPPELLLADTFDELSGDIAGQASGFSASPNHRWSSSWRWSSRSNDTKWSVVSGNVVSREEPRLQVRGRTRATSNLIRRFVIDRNSNQPLP